MAAVHSTPEALALSWHRGLVPFPDIECSVLWKGAQSFKIELA
jgi:hypothetical protein